MAEATAHSDRPDTHSTPTTLDAWHELAAAALKIDAGRIRRMGPVKPGGRGRYAGRRVFYLHEDTYGESTTYGLRSAEVIASDEENSAAPKIDTDDRSWWPYAAWGCHHGCGPDCERHGDAWDGGV